MRDLQSKEGLFN